MPADDLLEKTLLSQYRVDAFICDTPLGASYRVWDIRARRNLGLTLLPDEIASDPDALKALEAHLSPLKKLSHPSILPFHGLYQATTEAFFLEEWVDGPSLRDVLTAQASRPLDIVEALGYAKALTAALTFLHGHNLIHAALAPEMVRINGEGQVFLSGLCGCFTNGTSASLRPGNFPALYAAPEQYQGGEFAPSTDIYALGVMLFEMLTGRWLVRPSDDETIPDAETIRRAHTFLLPPAPRSINLDIPDFFSRSLLKTLAKKPAERTANARELFLTLCMAFHTYEDAVPARLVGKTAPATGAVLTGWQFLPPAETSTAIPLTPLRENMPTSETSNIKGKTSRNWLRPIIGIIVIAAFVALLSQIKPVTPDIHDYGDATGSPIAYTPPPTATLPPRPTDSHGGRIVFTCTKGDYNQLCTVNADGTGYRRLTNHLAHDYYPVFAPDGGMMVFTSNRNGAFDIYLLILNGNKLYQLTNYIGNVVSPDFSPDGQKIVFANRAADGPTSIWVVDQAGLNPKLLYAGPNTIVSTAWSPDGNTIAFAMAVATPNDFEIFLMNADGTNQRQLSHDLMGIGGSLDWSPDSRHLLIYAGPVGDKNVFELDASTGDAVQLTEGGNNAAASYSPNGKWIAFNSLRNDGQADIYIMGADGSNPRRITTDPEPDWQPQWEP